MAPRSSRTGFRSLLVLLLVLCLFLGTTDASLGDRLPEFKNCVKVCERENCDPDRNPTPIPLHRRLLLWTCPKECDYTCQQIITARRQAAGKKVTQFHGKWPFVRVLGMQEPFSVLFSLGNLWAHHWGLAKVRREIPAGYPLRWYYELFGVVGVATWIFSAVFHARDFGLTEELDYFAAGGSVLYGLYYAAVRVFRLDRPRRRAHLRLWTLVCCCLYAAHVAYLKFWRWNYTYNMTANVIIGVLQNSLWTYFSYVRWKESRRPWAVLPGVAVTWIMLAMSLELRDFPPLWGALDAHSLWHLGTIIPIMLWYIWMVKDSQDVIANNGTILKDTRA